MKKQYDCIVMGAAGRDFHVFLSFLKGNQHFHVKAFTATQIPHIEDRRYPASLAGSLYPEGIPIHPEAELETLLEILDGERRTIEDLRDAIRIAEADRRAEEEAKARAAARLAGGRPVRAAPEVTEPEKDPVEPETTPAE